MKKIWTGKSVYLIKFSKHAAKDTKKLKAANLDKKAKELIEIVRNDPFATSPRYEALVGNLNGMYSRRINIQHRLVYEVFPGSISENGTNYEGVVKVLSMWSHYEEI